VLRSTRILAAALGLTALAAGACSASKSATPASSQPPSSQAPTSSQTPTSSQAPEEKRATAAEVAIGLRKIDDTAKGVASKAAGDKAGAQVLDAQIEPVWKTIEGTVKANSQDGYASFEDSFGLLQSAASAGDAAKAGTASAAVSKAVADYLAKYPAS
jgi:glucose/arabinose dehydrogenase